MNTPAAEPAEPAEHRPSSTPAPVTARSELARLLDRQGQARSLLRHRVEIFAGIGVALGVAHLIAGHRSGSAPLALSATLGALVPVYAPLCFVPVAMAERERLRAGAGVVLARVGVAAALGWLVASVHLLVWAVLAALTGGISAPSIYDIPFMVVTVAVTAALAAMVYQLPRREDLAAPATVAAAMVLYLAAFAVHGTLLSPRLAQLRKHAGALPAGIEVAGVVLGMATLVVLVRREVRAASHEGRRRGGP